LAQYHSVERGAGWRYLAVSASGWEMGAVQFFKRGGGK
jgi:hypothetical protein